MSATFDIILYKAYLVSSTVRNYSRLQHVKCRERNSMPSEATY